MNKRWVRRPEGSNWGDFGNEDQIGRLNLLTPEKVRQGLAEAREGITFCLSLPLDYPGGDVANPRRHPPRLFGAMLGGQCFHNHARSVPGTGRRSVVCDDAVLLSTQYSTQWDSLAHVGAEFDADSDGIAEVVYYNGWRGGEHIVTPPPREDVEEWASHEGVSAGPLGIDTMAATCVQGRGVMVDLFERFGREHHRVGYDELMRIFDDDGVEVESGDMLCLCTGFDELLLEMNRAPDPWRLHNSCAGLDGSDSRLLQWITDSGVAALISDNRAVEILPPPPGAASTIHEHCLFKLGVPLGEQWLLSPLNRWLRVRGRNRFLLTAPPLRLPGAAGSPVTPVATV
ncbi:putative cyclase SCIF3.09c [Paraburkholderia unamae]|uniref:cyclase family protein n=1 Tax=Paraburkholderia unamae TaxID=219649 RepID=UPI001CAB8300|nr:cyclase family protein [Paraburkholderia unamae]CAG9262308.1 putative cyclase SCIF3.09c [Paraburkholderia unamae]